MRMTSKYLIGSVLLSILLGVLVYIWGHFYEITGFKKALEGILLLSSISLGFYGACLSVFASLFNTKIVKEIMKDKQYRTEFLMISCISLGIGFLTVIFTIVYQVMLENGAVPNSILQTTNALWIGLIVMFFSLQLIFIIISFSIFFQNSEYTKKPDDVYNPQIDESSLERK